MWLWLAIMVQLLFYLLVFGLPVVIFLFANRFKVFSILFGALCVFFAFIVLYLFLIEPGNSPGGSLGIAIAYMLFLPSATNGIAFIIGGLRKRKILVAGK